MFELFQKIPFYWIVVFFPIMWVLVSTVLSKISGWESLAKTYKEESKFVGNISHLQFFSFGHIQYKGCGIFGANSTHLFLSVLFPFRIKHPPLVIPYKEIVGLARDGRVEIKIQHVKISISKEQAEKMVEASNSDWNYPRLSNDA